MPVVIVEAIAPIASWRPPEALTYHPTYPLPPYTALVGMLAAGLGLDLPSGYAFVSENEIRLGVGGWHEGHLRDLWKYQKLKSKETVSAVILREHLIDMRMCIVIESRSNDCAQQIANAFSRPAFPLTAGQSDSILHAVSVTVEELKPKNTKFLHDVLVYQEMSPNYTLAADLDSVPLFKSIVAPVIHRIATSFSFDESRHRSLASRELVTFVGNRIETAEEVVGYPVQVKSRFFQVKSETQWIIPVHRFG